MKCVPRYEPGKPNPPREYARVCGSRFEPKPEPFPLASERKPNRGSHRASGRSPKPTAAPAALALQSDAGEPCWAAETAVTWPLRKRLGRTRFVDEPSMSQGLPPPLPAAFYLVRSSIIGI
jgi:hypothetical protein